ncbi:MAG: hypothetical protein ABGZ35_19140 [Planctomycetaceae bacterium]
MSGTEPEPTQKPRRWVKWVVSLLVCLHFFAILTAVTSSGSGRFNSPYLAMRLNEPFQPYLETLFLRNGYRFFAPNPGPNFVAWFRITYEDGRIRWYEFPRRKDFATPLAYTRMLSVANMGSQTYEHPADPDKLEIIPGTRICLSSYARYVASDQLVERGLREAGPVQTIEIYRVGHMYIMPDQIREGWDYTDLRLYEPIYLGAFRPDGSQIDRDAAVYCQTTVLVTDMIQNDIAPVLLSSEVSGPEAYAAELEKLGIPDPVRRLIELRPQIVSLSTAEITEHVRAAVGMETEDEMDEAESEPSGG